MTNFVNLCRASFRRQSHLEDAKTPSKRASKTKLRELKSKRRWSNIELAELQHQLTLEVDVDKELMEQEEGEESHPPNHSMVAVWSQYLDYEPAIPQLSAATISCHQLSSTQLSDIPGPPEGTISVQGQLEESVCTPKAIHRNHPGPIFEELVEDDSRDETLTLGGPLRDQTLTDPRATPIGDPRATPTSRSSVTIPSASPHSQQEEAIIEMEDHRPLLNTR